MDLTQLPFNKHIGLEHCESKEDGLLQLADDPSYLNHVGTVHASALYSLAEASGGQFLVNQSKLSESKVLPILRRAEIKYRKPAQGVIYSKGVFKQEDWNLFHETFDRKQRALLKFQIDLFNHEDLIVATAILEWFVAEIPR